MSVILGVGCFFSGQFDRVMRVSKSVGYPTGYKPSVLIQLMIDRGNISTALKHLNDLKDLIVSTGGGSSSGSGGGSSAGSGAGSGASGASGGSGESGGSGGPKKMLGDMFDSSDDDSDNEENRTTTSTLLSMFDVKHLIGRLFALAEYDNVIKYARRFNLTATFPTSKIVQGMLDSRMWSHAWKTIASRYVVLVVVLEVVL